MAETLPQLPTETANVPPPLALGPIEHVAHYSCDANGDIRYDTSNLSVFANPPTNANLFLGRDAFYEENRDNVFLGHPIPLDNLIGPCIALGAQERILAAHVVTWRGIMTNLMLGDAVDLQFSYLHGVLFVEKVDPTPWKKHTGQLRNGYHGYAFEALCTAHSPEEEQPVASLDLWKCVIRRTLGDLTLLIGGEVDCVRGDYDDSSRNFVELKTLRVGQPNRNREKWFLQSHLLGVPKIVVGYRDDNGILRRTQTMDVEEMYSSETGEKAQRQERAYRKAYNALTQLRAFCATAEASGETRGKVWRTRVSQGVVQQPRILANPRHNNRGSRVGLVASEYADNLAMCLQRGAV